MGSLRDKGTTIVGAKALSGLWHTNSVKPARAYLTVLPSQMGIEVVQLAGVDRCASCHFLDRNTISRGDFAQSWNSVDRGVPKYIGKVHAL